MVSERSVNIGDLMPDAVVVATARSPIGRAVKGSLKKTMCVGGDQGMDMVIERLG